MSKLLTEEELEEAIESYHSKAYWAGRREVDFDSEDKLRDELVRLIQSQKQAHADMVIGEDEPVLINGVTLNTDASSVFAAKRNELRAEQRARNT